MTVGRKVTGILWVGPVLHAAGYGNVSRNILIGLKKIGFPVKAVNTGSDHGNLLTPYLLKELKEIMEADCGSYPVVVVHGTPEQYPLVRCKDIVKKVGYTIFETDRIPKGWVGLCNDMDEIWVPSHFNLQTFTHSGVNAAKVKVLPYGVDTDLFKPIRETLFIEGKRDFCFLYVSFFDYRKGFDLLIEAYLKEFTAEDDVSLIIKTGMEGGNSHDRQNSVRDLLLGWVKDKTDLQRKDRPHLVIMEDPFNQEELQRLYNTCDLYISTDRANGWGMPCMEVMAMGKAAATIDWSGSTEFMREGNSLLIKPTGRLVPVDKKLARTRPLYKGQKWAEVEVNEVRRVMRFAYEHRDIIQDIGQRAMISIRNDYSHIKAAERMRDYVLSLDVSQDLRGNPSLQICTPSLAKRIKERLHRIFL